LRWPVIRDHSRGFSLQTALNAISTLDHTCCSDDHYPSIYRNKMNGIIKRHFRKQMTTDTKLRLHNITSKTSLCYGSETWTINKRDAQKLEAAQMRFLRPLLGLTRLDSQRNLEIRNSLKVDNIVEDIKQYQRRWVDHLERMDRSRLPRLAFQYQPRGWRERGRPRARWKDQEHLELQRNRS
jgi:hypothetical protein